MRLKISVYFHRIVPIWFGIKWDILSMSITACFHYTLRLLFIATLKFCDLANCVFRVCFNFAILQRFCWGKYNRFHADRYSQKKDKWETRWEFELFLFYYISIRTYKMLQEKYWRHLMRKRKVMQMEMKTFILRKWKKCEL